MFSKIIYRDDNNNSTERPTQRPTDIPPPSSSTVTPNIVVIKWEFFILGVVLSIVLVLAIVSIAFLCKKRNQEVRGDSMLGRCVVRWIPCLSGNSVPQRLINDIDEAFASNENAPIVIGGDRISNSQVIIDNPPPEQDVEVVNIVASSTIIQPAAFTNTWTKKNFIALFSKKKNSEMQPPAPPPNTPLTERPQTSQNTISQNVSINDIEC